MKISQTTQTIKQVYGSHVYDHDHLQMSKTREYFYGTIIFPFIQHHHHV